MDILTVNQNILKNTGVFYNKENDNFTNNTDDLPVFMTSDSYYAIDKQIKITINDLNILNHPDIINYETNYEIGGYNITVKNPIQNDIINSPHVLSKEFSLIRLTKDESMELYQEIINEVKRSISIHGNFNSLHEAYAVLLEEIDEVWDEIKNKKVEYLKIREELIQVAAVTIKTLQQLEELTS